MSAFGGLHIGTSAIHAAQRGLDVTGQNIANSATPGYTRQRVDLESLGGPGVPAFWSRYDGTGEGVKVTGISRLTDSFLVARANNAGAALGGLEEQAKTMAAIERTVGEPSDTGLQKQMQEFWNSWAKVAADPRGDAPRNLAYENAQKVTAHLNHMAAATQTQSEDTAVEIQAHVEDVNAMARDVARLNDAIRNNNIAKVPSNELLDQRDNLIARISELTGATVQPAEVDRDSPFNSQAVDVLINGRKLVDGLTANALAVSLPEVGDLASQGNSASVTLGGEPVVNGRIGGQLTSINTTIPGFLTKLDDVAATFADTVNAQQRQGYTPDAPATATGPNGADLFTGRTAASLAVASGTTPKSLAVSAHNPNPAYVPPPGTFDANGNVVPGMESHVGGIDGDNALAMSQHLRDPGGADAIYQGLVVQLGVDTQSVNRNVDVQRNVVQKAQDARDNVSGVSLNEEMTNLIRYQHSFSAAARFVSAIDQTLETLINMTR